LRVLPTAMTGGCQYSRNPGIAKAKYFAEGLRVHPNLPERAQMQPKDEKAIKRAISGALLGKHRRGARGECTPSTLLG
jgi:hypothetical protein